MRIAIIGGKLQGVEATYLAKKAGWEVVLFDRREQAQASHLADVFHCMDILKYSDEFISRLEGIDLILPALEDIEVLNVLGEISKKLSIPFLFDQSAYSVSSSKRISNQMFSDLDIPAPRPWPRCHLPLLFKPSDRSGSEGVRIIYTQEELAGIFNSHSHDEWIIEEYLAGPSYSIEVIGFAGEYRVFQITELAMDKDYDCKRVLAPSGLNDSLIKEFEDLALRLARHLSLNGIMDVETILHKGKLKVLEIDARLPSQTPTAVYLSSGVNIVESLGRSFVNGSLYIPLPKGPMVNDQHVIYEHFLVTPEKIEAQGEHILTQASPLQLYTNFFGADEVLTDYDPGSKEWVFTLITLGTSSEGAWNKRNQVLKRIQDKFNISKIIDSCPPGIDMPDLD